ncbi:chaperone protein Hsp33 [alpha proteobacterium U9-1i]|nr:chaperone protein Hsp33 [alpha proteobacterium U9-1i]
MTSHSTDDFVAPFSLDGAPVRGRVARLAAGALDPILRRHEYPRPVAMLLGEALTLAAAVGSLLKAEGRLVVQAQGSGPVTLLVAEHHSGGGLRGYARVSEGAVLPSDNRIAPAALLGAGHIVFTLDVGGEAPAYQGVAALEGETLAACAESYFRQSEQTDTAIKLAVGEATTADGATWRAGGLLMQKVAGDAARGDPTEDWSRARHLFATLSDAELIDPDLSSERLLYQLFHEEGVRMGERLALADQCTCNADRLAGVMKQFPPSELLELVEPDGLLHARCQFCAREYLLTPGEVGAIA